MKKPKLTPHHLMMMNLLSSIVYNYTEKVDPEGGKVWTIGYDVDDQVFYSSIDFDNMIDITLKKNDDKTYIVGIRILRYDERVQRPFYDYVGEVVLADNIIEDSLHVIVGSLYQLREDLKKELEEGDIIDTEEFTGYTN